MNNCVIIGSLVNCVVILTIGYITYLDRSALLAEIVSISIPNTCWGKTETNASMSIIKSTRKVKGRNMIFFNMINVGLCYLHNWRFWTSMVTPFVL